MTERKRAPEASGGPDTDVRHPIVTDRIDKLETDFAELRGEVAELMRLANQLIERLPKTAS